MHLHVIRACICSKGILFNVTLAIEEIHTRLYRDTHTISLCLIYSCVMSHSVNLSYFDSCQPRLKMSYFRTQSQKVYIKWQIKPIDIRPEITASIELCIIIIFLPELMIYARVNDTPPPFQSSTLLISLTHQSLIYLFIRFC